MKPKLTVLAVLASATALLAGAPVEASTVFRHAETDIFTRRVTQEDLIASGPGTLINSVGFLSGTQAFSQAISITSPGTLTVTLSEIPWLDTLQNLNCFLSGPGGGIIGLGQNGASESMNVQPGTIYVNWYAQASGPLNLGALGVAVQFSPATAPVPLPPSAILMLSGLAALAIGLGRSRLRPLTGG
jgi:hypothetical protein